MDSDDERELEIDTPDDRNKKGFGFVLFKFSFAALLFIIFAFFFLSLSAGLVLIFSTDLFVTSPTFVRSQCMIVSSSVDLRSSKVCGLNLLDYKAKHVFYPFDRNKFRCRYDYYWASVFEVEYKDHYLGQKQLANVEAPNEALPLNCRPNFGTAWLTKDKFKVNRTYDCWYTAGISKVILYRDGVFPCQAEEKSVLEMVRHNFILFVKILHTFFVRKKGKSSYWRWETIAGIVTGFSTSLISIFFISILHRLRFRVPLTYIAQLVLKIIKMVFFKRACFLLAYLTIMGWLLLQYVKRLGFPETYLLRNF